MFWQRYQDNILIFCRENSSMAWQLLFAVASVLTVVTIYYFCVRRPAANAENQ